MSKRQQLLFELLQTEDEDTQKSGVGALGGMIRSSEKEADHSGSGEPPKKQLYLRVNTFSIVLGITILLVILFCGYVSGRYSGKRKAISERSEEQISRVQAEKPQTEVLEVFKPTAVEVKEKTPARKKVLKYSRKKGVNYLIIQLFKKYEDAQKASEYLSENGVNTSIENLNRWYGITSITGFDFSSPEDKRKAEVFRDQIKALGRRYRKMKSAKGADFQTCFYKKWK